MKCVLVLAFVLLAFIADVKAAAGTSEATTIRRFALVASSNDGGPGRARLRFANSDAESVVRVLGSLGGVRGSDIIMVSEATRIRLQEAFADLKGRIASEKHTQVRREIFVYYSGHSDEEGLLLGGERVGYRELRQWIDGVGADVRIAILDSCASGSLIRLKGGVHRAPFLSDVSSQARGHAFLTASSADEAAQESDRVGAAFFTHYLLSGLRGAADVNRDRRVTLNEVYQFAYGETLQRTETSKAGAQHPAYDIQLAGIGDLVMTDLHASSSQLVLSRELAGKIYVRDSGGRLVVELRKEPTYPVELGLEPGSYRVVLDHDGRISDGSFDLANNSRVDISASSLTPVAALVSTRRGDELIEPNEAAPPLALSATVASSSPRPYRYVGFDLMLAPGFRMSGDTNEPIEHGFLLGIVGYSHSVRGVQLSVAGNIAQDRVVGAQIGGAFSLSYGPVRGVQIAGYNMAMGGIRGAQIGYASLARGPIEGAQIAMVNVAKGHLRGAQVGVVNIEQGDMNGSQVGLVNIGNPVGESRGAQVSLVNVNGGSGVFNGSSVGLVNVAQKQRGVQIGLVNVADEVNGVQVGLISYAKKNNGASISIIPVVLDGDNRLTLTWNSTSMMNLGVKLGTRRIYAHVAMGMTNDLELKKDRIYSTTYGLGGHIIPRGGRFYLDLDLSSTGFWTFNREDDGNREVYALRLQAGFALARHIALVVGASLNVQVGLDGNDRKPRYVSFAEKVWTSSDTTVRMYPGVTAGFEF
jgi:hypothetical protein